MSWQLAVVGAPAFSSFIFIFLSLFLENKKENVPLRTLFFFIGIGFSILTLSVARSIAEVETAPSQVISLLEVAISASSWIFYISIVIFILYFLISVILKIKLEKKW